jgi:S-adenosylmethionine synthetase
MYCVKLVYDSPTQGIDGNTCAVLTSINEQSPDIAIGVNHSKENRQGSDKGMDLQGAGDQGMMFGYACDETPELMPLAISLAHKLSKRLAYVRKSRLIDYLRPDGKTQVTIEYDGGKPACIDTIVIAAQHLDTIAASKIERDIYEHVIISVLPQGFFNKWTHILINPTGRFVIGGPQGDTGPTGRKIIVDTYGGYACHGGGGAFSGKDPSNVERSATYMARYAAKNNVAAGLARKCEIQVAYAIGVARPVSIMVDTFRTGLFDDIEISEAVESLLDFRPSAIIKRFLAGEVHLNDDPIVCGYHMKLGIPTVS